MERSVADGLGPTILIAFVVQAAIALGLRYWARSLVEPTTTWGRWLPRLPVIGLVLVVGGLGTTILRLVRAFGTVAGVDPSQKATMLAGAIADAMNATALLGLPGFLLYFVTAVSCLVYTFRSPRLDPSAPDSSR